MWAQACHPTATTEKLAGKYFGILDSLLFQLGTKTIRDAISWRSIHDCQSTEEYRDPDDPVYMQMGNERHLIDEKNNIFWSSPKHFRIYDQFLIGKKSTDGYSFKGGRPNQLGTWNLVNIPGAEISIDACDVHYLCDITEDRYTRHLIDQQSDKELFFLNVLGFPDLGAAKMVGLIHTCCEDSKSMQMSVGRGGPMSKSKLVFGKFDSDTVIDEWTDTFMPICFDGYGAQDRWNTFVNQHLRVKCRNSWGGVVKADLVPFFKSDQCPEIEANRSAYEKAFKWYKSVKSKAKLQYHQWTIAASIRQKCVEPLHCILRISITVLKYYILYCIEYCEWIQEEANVKFQKLNKYPKHSSGQQRFHHKYTTGKILKHFRNCCFIPFKFVKDQRGKSTISAGT